MINKDEKITKSRIHFTRKTSRKHLRLRVQGIALLIQNANFKGFFTGTIYQGKMKRVCVPGLNCYSCPGAVGACPIGSLQNALSGWSFKFPYYVTGLLIFFGALLGRAVCGWICPFGLIQELLHKIPTHKKIRTFRLDMPLRKLKYAILALMVIILPIVYKLTPFFCKYFCPAGTLAGLLLALGDRSLFRVVGPLFGWKVGVLAAILFLSVILYRPFCKYFCPLGAIYSAFNHVSLTRTEVDPEKCTHCGKCSAVCEMNIDPSRFPNHAECIRCGKCLSVCPEHALYSAHKASISSKHSPEKTR